MTPKWKVALGHIAEFLGFTALMVVLLVITPVACGQESDQIKNINGTLVREPAMPFLNPRIFGAVRGQLFRSGPYGILTPDRYPYVTPATTYTAIGDSITYGLTLTTPSTQAYPALLSAALGISVTNNGYSGDQACDAFARQISIPGITSHIDGGNLFTSQLGTNDVDVKHTGAYEAIFRDCHTAYLAWLATPRELMVKPGDSGMTAAGGCSVTPVNFSGSGIMGAICQTTAGTITTTLQTYGSPIYGWYVHNDANPTSACATVSVDGVTTNASYCTGTSPAIATQNGTTVSAGFIRIPTTAGTHTIVYSSNAATVGLIGWGTPSNGQNYFGHPVILSGDIPNQLSTGGASTPAAIAQYNFDVLADEAILVVDGVDIRHVFNQGYLLGLPAEMNDLVHPNVSGQQHLASAYLQAAQVPPRTATSPYLKAQLCSTSCSLDNTVQLVYIAAPNVTVTLPTPPANTVPTGQVQSITVTCFNGYAGCSLAVPSGSTGYGPTAFPIAISPNKSVTVGSFANAGQSNWIVTGSN